MTVVLTGDVHQTIGSSDQRFARRTEAALSVDYARIASLYGLRVTLFFTGRAVVEDGNDAIDLLKMDNVEIGGHGWDALRPRWWHRVMNVLTGSPHGPSMLQRQMIRRTCETLERYTSLPVRSWRNHAYRHNKETPYLLHEAGVVTWSDWVSYGESRPLPHPSGITVLPINTLPDHEHLRHGARQPELVAKEESGAAYPPDQWYDRISTQVDAITDNGGIATILAHPICMHVVDDFTTFEKMCRFLSRYTSLSAGEVPKCIHSS
jgi:hypothetical protein